MSTTQLETSVRRMESAFGRGLQEETAAAADLGRTLTDFTPACFDQRLGQVLARCLGDSLSDEVNLARVGAQLLRLKYADGDPMAFLDAGAEASADPLFLGLVSGALNVDPALEIATARYRRSLLFGHSNLLKLVDRGMRALATRILTRLTAPGSAFHIQSDEVAAAAAIAVQAHRNDYVLSERDDENMLLDRMEVTIDKNRQRLLQGQPELQWMILLYGMYRRLSRLHCARGLAEQPTDRWWQPVDAVLQRTVREPLEETALMSSITSVGRIKDAVSLRVRHQYEESPYPRWQASPLQDPTTLSAHLRDRFPEIKYSEAKDRPTRILIAGCGTGYQAIAAALRYPQAEVTGTDISLASLGHARRQMERLGINNLRLIQNDILEIAGLEARFDFIECVGVLHHLDDLGAGFAALTRALEPDGLMRIGLYSEIARQIITRARRRIGEANIEATPAAMKSFRGRILNGEEGEEICSLMRYRDFYNLNEFRDMLFHAREDLINLPRLATLLTTLSLEFLGFDLSAAGIADAYRQQYPADQSMTELYNWHKFETEHPEAFRRMYQFWCKKSVHAEST